MNPYASLRSQLVDGDSDGAPVWKDVNDQDPTVQLTGDAIRDGWANTDVFTQFMARAESQEAWADHYLTENHNKGIYNQGALIGIGESAGFEPSKVQEWKDTYLPPEELLCEIKTDYRSDLVCSENTYVAHNIEEISLYSTGFGSESGAYRDLELAFSPTLSKLIVHSPCKISVTDDLEFSGAQVCLDGRAGVKTGKKNRFEVTNLTLLSEAGQVTLGKKNDVRGTSVILQGAEGSKIRKSTVLELQGELKLTAGGGSNGEVDVGNGVRATAGAITLEGSANVKLGPEAEISSSASVLIASSSGRVAIQAKSSITAAQISLSAEKVVKLGPQTTLESPGEVKIISTGSSGGDGIQVSQRSKVSGSAISLQAPREISIDEKATLTASGALEITSVGSSKKCDITIAGHARITSTSATIRAADTLSVKGEAEI